MRWASHTSFQGRPYERDHIRRSAEELPIKNTRSIAVQGAKPYDLISLVPQQADQ